MKIPRALLGKYVEIVWRDPCSAKRVKVKSAPKGWPALATWQERGILGDLTDGVVRIDHSTALDPPADPEPEPELMATWVPESLVERVTVYEPVRTEDGSSP